MEVSVNKKYLNLTIRTAIYLLIISIMIVYSKLMINGNGLPCFFVDTYNVPCLTCGGTRALFALLNFDFPSAISLNPIFALVIYPISAILIIQDYIICIINTFKGTNLISVVGFILFPKPINSQAENTFDQTEGIE